LDIPVKTKNLTAARPCARGANQPSDGNSISRTRRPKPLLQKHFGRQKLPKTHGDMRPQPAAGERA